MSKTHTTKHMGEGDKIRVRMIIRLMARTKRRKSVNLYSLILTARCQEPIVMGGEGEVGDQRRVTVNPAGQKCLLE